MIEKPSEPPTGPLAAGGFASESHVGYPNFSFVDPSPFFFMKLLRTLPNGSLCLSYRNVKSVAFSLYIDLNACILRHNENSEWISPTLTWNAWMLDLTLSNTVLLLVLPFFHQLHIIVFT